MSIACAVDDFASLKAEIKRREERGEHDKADVLRKHLAHLEALKCQQVMLGTPSDELPS